MQISRRDALRCAAAVSALAGLGVAAGKQAP
ncbi:twin-arginine translocation signal domain-containing protein, partial [Mycolicibacterium elephantis]